MTDISKSGKQVFIRFRKMDGSHHLEPTSISKLSRASDYFRAFFLHTDSYTETKDGVPVVIFDFSIPVEDSVFVQHLLLHLQGNPLILSEENLATALILGDMWLLDNVHVSVSEFLKLRMSALLYPISTSKPSPCRVDVDIGVKGIVKVRLMRKFDKIVT